MLKVIPKPEGYDMAVRRADKTTNALNWGIADALYSAYEDMQKKPAVKAIVIGWYEEDENGEITLRNRIAGDTNNDMTALAVELFHRVTRT